VVVAGCCAVVRGGDFRMAHAAVLLIVFLIVGTGGYAYDGAMGQDIATANEVICPVCGQTMTNLRRIRRALNGDLDVFQCKSCKFSTTYAVKMAPAA